MEPTITRFYKILYKGKDVVYVGVTLREINERFREHIFSKSLNLVDYSIIEFDRIEHPLIDSIHIYYEERKKVVELEKRYIQEEKDKGSVLLNLGPGGEGWGSSIIEKLRKDDFFIKHGSWEGYKEYSRKIRRCYQWVNHWAVHRCSNKCSPWLGSWVLKETKSKCGTWLYSWVAVKTRNRYYEWLGAWVHQKTENRCKYWLAHWVDHRKCA